MGDRVQIVVRPPVSEDDLNSLFTAAWEDGQRRPFSAVHEQSLFYLCAFAGDRLVGYVNVAWDGAIHAFLLNPTVHPDAQRRGIGTELVRQAMQLAAERGVRWMHVDFAAELKGFYAGCGFRETAAGIAEVR